MASGSFDYSSDPRFSKVRRSAQFGLYDQDTLSQALQNPDLMGIEGYDPMAALRSVGDVGRFGDTGQFFDEYTAGLSSAIAADPSARDPGFQGMSFSEFQRLFPDRAKSYIRSDAYNTALNTPSPANPAAVSSPGSTASTTSTWGAEDRARAEEDKRRQDREELERRRREEEERKRQDEERRRQEEEDRRRREDEERRRQEEEDRRRREDEERRRQEEERRRQQEEERIREEERTRLAEASRGTASGPEAQPEVEVTAARPAVVHQAEGPSVEASTATGGYTDQELRQQQMDAQREAVASAEEAAAESVRGLPALQIADPNLNIELAKAEAPSGGPDISTSPYISDISDPGFKDPTISTSAYVDDIVDPGFKDPTISASPYVADIKDPGFKDPTISASPYVADIKDPGFKDPSMLASGDIEFDPEYFQYETDLGNVYLDALRQSLTGEGGVDPQAAAQMADLEARQARDEAQTVEDLQRYGVLRGGGDTADVLGELRSGYGRTYKDILADQAYRQMNDPRYQAALDLAGLKSDRYMSGGEAVGRIGGQDTLEARQAQQDAIERQAGITLESQQAQQQAREAAALRDLQAQESQQGAIERQAGITLESQQARQQAREEAALRDLRAQESQQGAIERQAGITLESQIAQQQAREEAALRDLRAQESQQAAIERESGISGFLRGARSLEGRQQDIDAQFGRADRQLEAARDLASQYDRAAGLSRDDVRLQQDVADRGLARGLTITEPTTRERFEEGVRSAQVAEGLAEAGVTGRFEGRDTLERDRMEEETKRVNNELANKVRLGILDTEKSIAIQELINSGELNLAQKELDAVEATLTSEEKRQTERVEATSRDLQNQLANNINAGILDAEQAIAIQELINEGSLDIAKKELEAVEATLTSEEKRQTERVGQEDKESQRRERQLKWTLENAVELGEISSEQALGVQELINEGQLDLATEETTQLGLTLASEEAMQTERVESEEAMQTERVGMEERESQRRERQLKMTLDNAVELGHISSGQAQRVQELINEGQLDLATEETTQLGLTLASEEAMQTERVEASSADLAAQLENNIALGNIDMNKAVEIQTLINSGELELAQKELEGITATLESEERKQTERVGQEDKESQRRERQLKMTLDNAVELGHISSGQAQRVQELINEGQLDLATEETTQLGLTLASEEAMQTERVGQEERESQRRERQLKWTLENAVELGHISSGQAQRVQELINKGQLDLATEETTQLGLTLASEEAMQTERIESEEGMFANEMEFQRAIATGEIDGMPTLDAMVTRAELANMLSARQAEGIGQMLALANAIPNEETRAEVMASIARPLKQYMETGGGYTDLKLAFQDGLNVDVSQYLPEG